MAKGSVYLWELDGEQLSGGRLKLATVDLPHLWRDDNPDSGLVGRYVDVVNVQKVYRQDRGRSRFLSEEVGNARPDTSGNFMYHHGFGGNFPDEIPPLGDCPIDATVSASHFGEVNVYWHFTSIADRVEKLLLQLGERSLPRVVAVIGDQIGGGPGGVQAAALDKRRADLAAPQGVTYQFPESRDRLNTGFCGPLGEIVFGPGTYRTDEGWLPRLAGASYLCNPSHIAGFIYQAYGQHIVRHTADPHANELRAPGRQRIEDDIVGAAVSRFWAAAMLSSPHIWSWHRRDDANAYADGPGCSARTTDPGHSGRRVQADAASVLASALWGLKAACDVPGQPTSELLVLAALINLRKLQDDPYRPDRKATLALRSGVGAFAACLLHADAERFGSANSALLKEVMKERGIDLCFDTVRQLEGLSVPALSHQLDSPGVEAHLTKILDRFPEAIIPKDDEIVHPDDLESHFVRSATGPYDVAAVGDVMTGMRMRHRIAKYGQEYPFAWVKPIFRRAAIVTGNLEGPFADKAEQAETARNFSYKVDPRLASVLRRGGFNAMTIANNHILDCGHEGVVETLEALQRQRIAAFGGGRSEAVAHDATIFVSRGKRIGLLGYYWNKRTAARGTLAGSARDLPELVERDFDLLRKRVDRIVVMVHWGVPYERKPTDADMAKARHFVDCGADAVIGHHPHIIQPMEIYKGRPILYSVGNFAFGSGNSKAESLLPCLRFDDASIDLDIYPVYVQNRDLRIDYQPKIVQGAAGEATLKRLELLAADGTEVSTDEFSLRLRITH